jgi:hypothetical protein
MVRHFKTLPSKVPVERDEPLPAKAESLEV